MKSTTKKPENISLYEFFKQFPDEVSATRFFEKRRWKDEVSCPHCGSKSVAKITSGKPMPYRCRNCREHFSVRTGTVLAESKLALHKWLMAIYMLHTARKGVSSVQMAKELGVTQKTAWFLDHRIREAMKQNGGQLFGTVEADETFVGGLEKNKHASKRIHAGRGGVGKSIVFGLKSRNGETRAKVLEFVDRKNLHQAVKESVAHGSVLYTDEHRGYYGLKDFRRTAVNHSRKQYVNGDAHTNGIESFWALFKRGYHGIYHQMSKKHLQRYVNEFASRNSTSSLGTIDCMNQTVSGMLGRRLSYKELIA
jgi:transposase-like protein